MDGNAATIRDLTHEEIALVSGAWEWDELIAAAAAGGVTGGMMAWWTGAAWVPAIVGGALTGAAAYLVRDMIVNCF